MSRFLILSRLLELVGRFRRDPALAAAARSALQETEGLDHDLSLAYLTLVDWVARLDREAAHAAAEALGEVLTRLGRGGATRWTHRGISLLQADPQAGRDHFARRIPSSKRLLRALERGLAFEEVRRVLQFYAEALAGRPIALCADDAPPRPPEAAEAEVLVLPARLAYFPRAEDNFSLYKLMITHALGRRELVSRPGPGPTAPEDGDPLWSYLQALAEAVCVDEALSRRYPGIGPERERLLSLELDYRPALATLSARGAFTELLTQRAHLGRTREPVPAAWKDDLNEATCWLDALRGPQGDGRTPSVIARRLCELIRARFPGLGLDAEGDQLPPPFPHQSLDIRLISPDPDRSPAPLATTMAPSRGGASLPLTGAKTKAEAASPSLLEDPAARVTCYDEWDFRRRGYRRRWCRLTDQVAVASEGASQLLPVDPRRVRRVRAAFEWLAAETRLRRLKRQKDGDDLDLDAWVDHRVDRRRGSSSGDGEKLYLRRLRRERDLSVALLLDQSDSTRRRVPGGRRVIELEQEALLLLCEALEVLQDDYGVFSYSGSGRDGVVCYTIKDFHEPYGPRVRDRLASLEPLDQNRDGCALRHLTRRLLDRESRTRLLMHLCDGQPWDHGYSQRYALEDTRKAIQEARSRGVKVFGVLCNAYAPARALEVYGRGGCLVLRDVEALPQHLPLVYRRLTV